MPLNPLVSVITALYNAEEFIGHAIESVIHQSYPNWEMIIVDDCSTDDSRRIVAEYSARDTRINLIESKDNFGGPARPRNIGIQRSRGDYIAFLDADDFWFRHKLSKQTKFLQNSHFKWLYSKFIFFDEIFYIFIRENSHKSHFHLILMLFIVIF